MLSKRVHRSTHCCLLTHLLNSLSPLCYLINKDSKSTSSISAIWELKACLSTVSIVRSNNPSHKYFHPAMPPFMLSVRALRSLLRPNGPKSPFRDPHSHPQAQELNLSSAAGLEPLPELYQRSIGLQPCPCPAMGPVDLDSIDPDPITWTWFLAWPYDCCLLTAGPEPNPSLGCLSSAWTCLIGIILPYGLDSW